MITINPNITYEQHLDFLRRVRDQAQAEMDGFLQGKHFELPNAYYSNRPNIQAAYVQGFETAKAKMMIETKGGNASELIGATDAPIG